MKFVGSGFTAGPLKEPVRASLGSAWLKPSAAAGLGPAIGDAAGAVVQNMLRRTSFGWSRVRDIDFRWQLEFSLDDGTRVSAYGGPARSRPTRTRVRDDEAAKAPAGVRDLADIRDLWQAADGSADAPIRREWDVRALIALAVLVVWAVAAVLIVSAG